MAEHERQSQPPPKNFGQLTKDVLQNIFRLGVQESWPTSDEEEMEDSSSAPSSEGDYEEHECFMPKKKFRPRPELRTIMNCAVVCRSWADAVLDMRFWEAHHLVGYLEDLAEPWKLGSRGNQFLANVPVVIPCSATLLLSSIGKSEVSASRGRTRFSVYFPVRGKRRQNIYKAWQLLRSFLWKHCAHLEFITRGEDGELEFGLGDLIFRPWPQLQSLKLNELFGSSWPGIEAISRLLKMPAETLRQNPPLPELKFMSFRTHPHAHLAREVLNIAPNIEDCMMDTSGYRKEPGWGMHRNCVSHLKFLDEDKRFRTYVTPFFMHAFKWPGPKKLSMNRFCGNLDRICLIHPTMVSSCQNAEMERSASYTCLQTT